MAGNIDYLKKEKKKKTGRKEKEAPKFQEILPVPRKTVDILLLISMFYSLILSILYLRSLNPQEVKKWSFCFFILWPQNKPTFLMLTFQGF